MKLPIYLDHMATTPVDPRVLEAMLPYFGPAFGNAASKNHPFGWTAREGIDRAREQVAGLIGASPADIVFTSGSTESINLAIKGAAEMYASKGRHIVTTRIEHPAVLDSTARLEKRGFEVTYVAPDAGGRVDADAIAAALRDDTILVSVMWANNEVGTLADARGIGQLCHERGVLFFTDATQAVGKVPADVEADGIDMLSLSAHKIYGPKGAGCLYVRRKDPRVRLAAQMDGGGHERGMRSGTLNVPGIVGLGAACQLCHDQLDEDARHSSGLRDSFEARVFEALGDVHLNGDPAHRVPGCSNLSFGGLDGAENLIQALSGIAVSSGSACTSGSSEASHVLTAMGIEGARAFASVRFGFGRPTTDEEVQYAGTRVIDAVQKLRGVPSPVTK